MAQGRIKIDVTEGACITRADHTLGPGELVSAAGVRFKHGDSQQIHRDVGIYSHSDAQDEQIDAEYIHFEKSPPLLLALKEVDHPTWPTSVQLQYINAHPQDNFDWRDLGDPIQVVRNEADRTVRVPEQMAAIHRGDEYFIGTGTTPQVLRDGEDEPQLIRMGMRVPYEIFNFDTITRFDWKGAGSDTIEVKNRKLATMPEVDVLVDVGVINVAKNEGRPDGVTLPPSWPDDAGTGNNYGRHDYLHVYYITEYDEDSDVESQPIAMLPVQFQVYRVPGVINTPFTCNVDNWMQVNCEMGDSSTAMTWDEDFVLRFPRLYFGNYVAQNERATHVRIYRQYIGDVVSGPNNSYTKNALIKDIMALWGDKVRVIKDFGSSNESAWMVLPNRAFVQGSLMETVDLSEDQDWLDLPPLDYRDGGPGDQTEYYRGDLDVLHTPPRAFTCGCVFEDKVLTNIAAEPSVLQYSVTSRPEYFPEVNTLPLVTDGDDTILQIHNLDNFVAITTPGSVHRLDYLPGYSDPNRAPVAVMSTEGCVGSRASTVVTLPQGNALVWLSEAQLNLSTGRGGLNACEDWSVGAAGLDVKRLEQAILVNNREIGRLELYVYEKPVAESGGISSKQGPQVRYDFYYARQHMKGGGFKMLGPSPVYTGPPFKHALVASSADRSSPIWYGLRNGAWYNGNTGVSANDVIVQLPRLFIQQDPMTRLAVHFAAMQHSALTAGQSDKLLMEFIGKSFNRPANPLKRAVFISQVYDELDYCTVTGVTGNYIKSWIKYQGGDDLSFGPLYLDIEVDDDGR